MGTHLDDAQGRVALAAHVAHGVGVGHAHGAHLHALVLQAPQVVGDAVKLFDDLVEVGQQRHGPLLLAVARQAHGGQRGFLPADLFAAHRAARAEGTSGRPHEPTQAVVAQRVAAREGVGRLVELHAVVILVFMVVVMVSGVDVVQAHGVRAGVGTGQVTVVAGAGGTGGGTVQGALGVLEGGAVHWAGVP